MWLLRKYTVSPVLTQEEFWRKAEKKTRSLLFSKNSCKIFRRINIHCTTFVVLPHCAPPPPPAIIIFTWLSILSTRSNKTAVVPNFFPTSRPTMCFAKNPEKMHFFIFCFLDYSKHFLKPGFTHTHSTLSNKQLILN